VLAVVNLFLDLVQINVSDCVFAIEDPRDVLKRGTLGLDVKEVHEGEFNAVPELKMQLAQRSDRNEIVMLTV
jgi:hypothetical protein